MGKNVPKLRFRGFEGEWEEKKIGETLKIKHGKDQKNIIVENGKYPILGTGGEFGRTNTPIYSKESVLIGRKGTIDKPMYMNSPFWTVDTLFYSEIKNNYYARFLFYNFQIINWKKYCEASGVPSLSASVIENILIKVPSLQEQEKIANLLSKVDRYIELQEKKVSELEKYKKGMMQKIFSQKIRFRKDDGGEYPEWERKKLNDIVEFLDGKRKPLESSEREKMKGIYPYYGASGIIDYVNNYIFDEELILLSEDGANIIDRNYRVCFLAKGKYWVNNHAHVLKSRQGNNNKFICEALERLNYSKYNTGTAQPKLNQDVCKNIYIDIPILQEQEKIAKFLSKVDLLIEKQRKRLDELKLWKKGLLQKMFV